MSRRVLAPPPDGEFYGVDDLLAVASGEVKPVSTGTAQVLAAIDKLTARITDERPAPTKGLSGADVAERLGCSYDSALRLMKAAGAVKVGNLVRIESERLTAYLEEQRCRAQGKQPTSSNIEGSTTRTSTATIADTPSSTAPTKRRRSKNSPSLSRYSAADLRQDLPGRKR